MLSAQVTKKVDEKSTGTFWIFLEVQMNDEEKPLTLSITCGGND